MNNEYECKYFFEDKQKSHKPCETAILLMTDKQFAELIYSSSNQTD